jgi:hypothetical protein
LNATDAPTPDLHIEEALTELEGPRFFLVQRVLCDLIPLLNVDQNVLLALVASLTVWSGAVVALGVKYTSRCFLSRHSGRLQRDTADLAIHPAAELRSTHAEFRPGRAIRVDMRMKMAGLSRKLVVTLGRDG